MAWLVGSESSLVPEHSCTALPRPLSSGLTEEMLKETQLEDLDLPHT